MADRAHGMESAVPAKRPRLDFPDEISSSQYGSDFQCFAGTSELISGSYSNGGDFTITSDSGFNELTPPQSMEDEITTPTSSSQGGLMDRPENENDFGDENTNDSSVNDGPDNWQNSSTGGNQDDEDEDDRQSVASTASNLSGLSDFSNFSGKDWKPCAGPMSWVQQQMLRGVDPRSVLTHMLGSKARIPEGMSDVILWRFILNMLVFSEPPRREKLRHINTLEDVVRLMKSCRKIIVLTGAGVSVSCGIPDFRSRDGIYARLAVDFPDLPNPEAMFDIHHFRRDPRPFFTFAKEIYPGQFTPSLCHKFIRLLEQHNKLLRNYTQNIDTLEQVAGIKNVIQCHGSFATATCQQCGHKVDADAIKEDIFSQRIPKCPICIEGQSEVPESSTTSNSQQNSLSEKNSSSHEHKSDEQQKSPGNATTSRDNDDLPELDILSSHRLPEPCQVPLQPIMKPDIVFFGEGLPDEFHDRMAEDKDECDLLIVIGSSLKVRPVALIPSSVPSHVPQILINREPLRHLTFDVELLGDCDVIINELCQRMGNSWKELSSQDSMTEIRELPPRPLPPISINSADGDDTNSSMGTTVIAPQHAPHPRDESDIEALRACWAPKIRETVASRLPDNMFLYTGSHKYIFPGAEVYYDPDDDFEEEEDDKCHSSESENEDDVTQEDDSQSGNDLNSTASSHHPRLDDCHSTDAPHLSPEDVDSLLSAADNGQSQEHEDWTSLNASLDTSLDCDHTLPGCDTDNEQTSDNNPKVTDFSNNRYSPPADL